MTTNNMPATTYHTPIGIYPTWEQAAAACERCDFDPVSCIRIVRD